MGSRNRLPFVQRRTRADGSTAFRPYVKVQGKLVFGAVYDTEAQAYEAALRMRGAPRSGRTLYEACETVLDELRTKRSPGTVRWYSDHFRALYEALDMGTAIAAITPERLEQFVRDRIADVSAATVNADLRALHRVFAVAIRQGHALTNPVRQVDRPRADRPAMDWFAEDQLAAIIEAQPDQRARDILLLFAMTGVRRAEAARLEAGHVRLQVRKLTVPGKTGVRLVPIGDDLAPALERLSKAANGGRLLPRGAHEVAEVFRAARKQCGDRRLHPHALRHTFGTALVRNGVALDVVMRLMGHASLTTTMRYVHEVGPEADRAVATLRIVRRPESPRSEQA